ncbi:arsenosugar biosynthesis radical SAM (seleno)protein ArsS [Leptolyngbya iicbica]|uniref:Radical SAM/Cys-rich domain protein n=2 Tax=Cyanophyceae TaxID=3028117 RepID=A0A4Q7E108_9CYAN|nr:arsenosugar biosynthesis radical SAM (seleno)protein ArsS [Leptolyngbya sp. LK]RZM75195.1 radical SAM/Cys-rich domain protein [Leptolyngbya sp. LK]
MVLSSNSLQATASANAFETALGSPLTKQNIQVLQINLGRRCNLSCTHCHVEAGPHRTEELTPAVLAQLLEILDRFPQIRTVDLTGGAPEMNYGFRPLVERAHALGKEIIVRSNLTIFFEPGFADLPAYFTQHQVRVVASLPCYLPDNVDSMRGQGVYDSSIRAIQQLNALGYGTDPNLILDLVYNPPIPKDENFRLTPSQAALEGDYKAYLAENFDIAFNQLLTITNIPIGRTRFQLEHRGLLAPYTEFLAAHHNPANVSGLMCRNELSIDYEGRVYDCDFNQMAGVSACTPDGEPITLERLLAAESLDVIATVQTRPYCYGCTAGSGSSCGGALTN